MLGGLERGELFWESLSFVSTPGGTDAICLMSRIQGIDALDARDVSRAEQEGRRQITSIVRFLKREIPGFERAQLADVAERVGVRESRRVEGRYTLTEDDIMGERAFDDAIALGAGPMDRHQAGGTGIRLYAPPSPFEIPLRSLIPVAVEGLLVCGRTLSATRDAMAGARHMATSMAMGQAVGTLGALASAQRPPPVRRAVRRSPAPTRERRRLLPPLAGRRRGRGDCLNPKENPMIPRKLSTLVAAAALLLAGTASAQEWPTRTTIRHQPLQRRHHHGRGRSRRGRRAAEEVRFLVHRGVQGRCGRNDRHRARGARAGGRQRHSASASRARWCTTPCSTRACSTTRRRTSRRSRWACTSPAC